jgi:protein O-GlcNAc transferase
MDSSTNATELFRRGNLREAARICERRLALSDHDAEALTLLAEIHLANGEHERAATLLRRLVRLQPRNAAAHRRLAGALVALGRAKDAVPTLRQAIEIEPDSTRAHNNLGQALMQIGDMPGAISSFQDALRLNPNYVLAQHNLGLALMAAGHLEQALPCFELALAHAPHLPDAWVGRGTVLAGLGRREPAVHCFETALKLRPEDAAAWTKKAQVLLTLERASESLDSANEAIRLDECAVEAHNVRAGALRRLGRHADALRSLDRALALDSTHAEAWRNHSTILHEMGRIDAALASGRKALECDPYDIKTRTRLLARLIPQVPLSMQEIDEARQSFVTQLSEFESWLRAQDLNEQDALTVAQQQFFYLSYQEESNRELLQRYRSDCASRLAGFAHLTQPAGRVVEDPGDSSPRRFRLGFVSAHLYDHSVFNALVQGWLHCLDRTQFEITLFGVGSKQDEVTRTAATAVDVAEIGARPLDAWIRIIRERDLDALIYPEIGMNETTMALAALRLAPRQFAAWGHPETSGFPTIDGYLSAELFEPGDAQNHYTERLIRLPNLGVHYRPHAVEPTTIDLRSFGIDGAAPVLVCPGVPFKYAPKDDRILVEIARGLRQCTFVFFQHESADLSRKLHGRMAAAFEEAQLEPAKFLRLIPWQPRPAFFGLLQRADVYLDTIGFSGFNTMMQAIECDLPCVTYQGKFMRGRLGSGILDRLGLSQWIARDRQQYIDLAVELGSNAQIRADVRASIRKNKTAAYEDRMSVEALARVLLESRIR